MPFYVQHVGGAEGVSMRTFCYEQMPRLAKVSMDPAGVISCIIVKQGFLVELQTETLIPAEKLRENVYE